MLSHRRLRVAFALAFCTLLLTAVACDSTPSGSASSATSAATSAASSKTASSSAETSSAESQASSAQTLPETDERGYVLVANAVKKRDLAVAVADVSEVFDAAAPGYVVEGGPYLVNADTLKRLTTAKVEGSGSVKYVDFKVLRMDYDTDDPFTGEIPVSKLHDPVYVQMNLPSEAQTFMTTRVNPENMAYAISDRKRFLPIAAIYRNEETSIADTETFTVCLGRICILLKTKDKDWYIGDERSFPDNPVDVFHLPWEAGTGTHKLPRENLNLADDHIEVTMTGADLNATAYRDKGAKGAVLHFWGSFAHAEGSSVTGMASSYVAWIKEGKMAGKLVGAVGIDCYLSSGSNDIKQAYSGYNYLLDTSPRVIFGHTVGPRAYDTVMDTEKVQQLLGIKGELLRPVR